MNLALEKGKEELPGRESLGIPTLAFQAAVDA
jgi:hypothetical protein